MGLKRRDFDALPRPRHRRGHHLPEGHPAQRTVEVEEPGHRARGGGRAEADPEALPGGTEVHLHLAEVHPGAPLREGRMGEEVVDPGGLPHRGRQEKPSTSRRGEEGLDHERRGERHSRRIEGVPPCLEYGKSRLERDRMPAGHGVHPSPAHRSRPRRGRKRRHAIMVAPCREGMPGADLRPRTYAARVPLLKPGAATGEKSVDRVNVSRYCSSWMPG